MKQFQDEVGAWGDATFGTHSHDSICEHLLDEVKELKDSQMDSMEAADCLILLLQHAHTFGYDLLHAAELKMAINRNRKWAAPDERGVVRHID